MKNDPVGYYEANIKLVHRVALQAQNRLDRAGMGADYQDTFADMREVFFKSMIGFDEGFGTTFSTYFMRAAHNKMNRVYGPRIKERLIYGVRNVQELLHPDSRGEDALDFLEFDGCDTNAPDRILEAKQFLENLDERLSPVAKLMVELIVSPPKLASDQMDRIQAHSLHVQDLGGTKRQLKDVTLISTFMIHGLGIDADLVKGARQELDQLREHL
jgi:hypothetical protein